MPAGVPIEAGHPGAVGGSACHLRAAIDSGAPRWLRANRPGACRHPRPGLIENAPRAFHWLWNRAYTLAIFGLISRCSDCGLLQMPAGFNGLLRARDGAESSKVTFVELFFDLVFVFAVTQLSHALLEHLTFSGAAQTTLLLMAVWWVWIYTSWATNWLDPEKIAVRLMMFALMLAGLVLSTSIPQAFETKATAFASAYVFMQVGRGLFTMGAVRPESPGNYRNFQRINAWLVLRCRILDCRRLY